MELRRTVSLVTVGCKLNQYETQVIEEAFVHRGYRVVPFGSEADVCIVNSCTVTGRSDYRSRQLVRRARRANPSALVVMAGCYPQRDAGAVLAMPDVDLAVGNIDRTRIPEIIERLGPGERRSVVSDFSDGVSFEKCATRGLSGHTRAFIKIQDGCDERCSYCAVSGVRGPDRSRPLADVLDAVGTLLEGGFREIVLTGVHVGNYGSGLDEGTCLVTLLKRLCERPGRFRIRLSSMEPRTIADELIHLVASDERICNHFHIPLQSGDDRILTLMGRPYDSSHYARLIHRIKNVIPDCGLGADVMVGFPTEDQRSFDATVGLIESLPLTYLHVFSYSPRPGTKAYEMSGEPSGEVKKERSRILRATGRAKARIFRKSHLGTALNVLSEGRDRHVPYSRGYTSNYIRVYFEEGRAEENQFVDIRAESLFQDGLKGVLKR
jgi:threonylcarbamoyladenosine tRNA methylthiotransferase MtaB